MTTADRSKKTSPLGVSQVIAIARDNVALFADMQVDQIVSCKRSGEDWQVEVDLIEARARLGDNDLIATFSMTVSPDGSVLGIERLRRYTRDDLRATG
ncbi:MAG: gas vesicle protein GvpO [Paracoccaceae bacterium]